MVPFAGLVLGVAAGAVGVVLFGPQIAQQARPLAKAVLKAVLVGIHEARVRGAEVTEAAEDLYAEAKSEVTAEVLAAAMAAAQAKAAGQSQRPDAETATVAKTARKRAATRRSKAVALADG